MQTCRLLGIARTPHRKATCEQYRPWEYPVHTLEAPNRGDAGSPGHPDFPSGIAYDMGPKKEAALFL